MDIKTIIETKIKDANLTKKEVAERMGIIPNNINAMLANPSWPTLQKLSDALGIPVSELVSDVPRPEREPLMQQTIEHGGKQLRITIDEVE